MAQTFEKFMEREVLPQLLRDPSKKRLDGRDTGGNREVFGIFTHELEDWHVNADSHFEPLILAYYAAKYAPPGVPAFDRVPAEGPAQRLALSKELQNTMRRDRPQYFYAYPHR